MDVSRLPVRALFVDGGRAVKPGAGSTDRIRDRRRGAAHPVEQEQFGSFGLDLPDALAVPLELYRDLYRGVWEVERPSIRPFGPTREEATLSPSIDDDAYRRTGLNLGGGYKQGRRVLRRARRARAQPGGERGGHEGVEIAVQHRLGVPLLDTGPEVLDHLVGLQDV